MCLSAGLRKAFHPSISHEFREARGCLRATTRRRDEAEFVAGIRRWATRRSRAGQEKNAPALVECPSRGGSWADVHHPLSGGDHKPPQLWMFLDFASKAAAFCLEELPNGTRESLLYTLCLSWCIRWNPLKHAGTPLPEVGLPSLSRDWISKAFQNPGTSLVPC